MQSPRTRPPRSAGGFTLIELLVVIGIIILLAAILIPAVGAARRSARKVDNTALLNSIATDIDQYYTIFNTYPGTPDLNAGVNAGADGSKAKVMSGTQSLLLALSYGWYSTAASDISTTPLPTQYDQIPNTILAWDPMTVGGPRDYGNRAPSGAARSYAPLYNPTSRELSPPKSSGPPPVWDTGGITGSVAGNKFAFPTILDHYSSQMPILYYRRTQGTAGSITYDSSGNVSDTVVSYNTTTAPYVLYDNDEYTDSKALGTAGVPPQQQFSGLSEIAVGEQKAMDDLAGMITGTAWGTTYNAHGNFVLMSAGEDRVYGPNVGPGRSARNDPNKKGPKTWDDIVIVH